MANIVFIEGGKVMTDLFENVIADFKSSESPESVLVVGDDQDRVKLVLAWPNVPINRND